ncbi:helix-turn-helix domain-containing protein [Alistipes sp.]|uniref:helix-turn-helix domain-containing protein n=1 Tax=Alistipes sp. TaxID=1872444 RepID=UPI003AB84C4F
MQPWRDTTLLEAIAGKLKELRVAKGVSQETVYEDTGIHIGKIETARYNITVSTLSKLCNYYGITLKEFFDKLGK